MWVRRKACRFCYDHGVQLRPSFVVINALLEVESTSSFETACLSRSKLVRGVDCGAHVRLSTSAGDMQFRVSFSSRSKSFGKMGVEVTLTEFGAGHIVFVRCSAALDSCSANF